jgi:hypothetical protein
MTGEVGKAWFIDAWAVHDGRVFASRRLPESISADATVFMSVPDLEPVPVGRISTALRATRSGFQEGLRTNDSDLAEIPFENLRQVRDLVRRAFLAAGLGPGSPAGVAGPVTRPDRGSGPGRAFLAEEPFGRFAPQAPVDLLEVCPPPDLEQAIYAVAKATVLEWDLYLEGQEPDEIRGLVGWLGALTRAGMLQPAEDDVAGSPFPTSLLDLAARYNADNLLATLQLIADRWLPGSPFEAAERISGYWSRGHLAIVPLPTARRWPGRVRRLADMSLLPVIDRRFWTSDGTVTCLDVAPLVLSHAIRQPARSGRLRGEPSPADAAFDRARGSMAWFRDTGLRLPPAAEWVLADFIDSCLDGPTGAPRGAPDPAPRPAPVSPSPVSPSRARHDRGPTQTYAYGGLA